MTMLCISPKTNPYRTISPLLQRLGPSVNVTDITGHVPGMNGIFGVIVRGNQAAVVFNAESQAEIFRSWVLFEKLFLIPISEIEQIDPEAASKLWPHVLLGGDI